MTPEEWQKLMDNSPRLGTALLYCFAISGVLGIISLIARLFGWR